MAKMKDMTAEEMKKELALASEKVRAFKFALPGTPTRNLKEYKASKKLVAQLLTKLGAKK